MKCWNRSVKVYVGPKMWLTDNLVDLYDSITMASSILLI